MSRLLLKTQMTWLLLMMLLISSTSSPALAHSHADWQTPGEHHLERAHHDEGSQQGAKAANHHSCGHGHSHPPDASGSAVRHWHVSWLGLEFTLPAPPEEPQGDSESSATIVRLLAEAAVPLRGDDVERFELPLWLACDHRWHAVVPVGSGFSSTPVGSAQLCDVARRARSGVLQI